MKTSKSPYVIQEITLITYRGKKIPLTIVENKIIDIPIRSTKDKILNAFSSMKDKPVDVKLKVKYISSVHKSNENKRRITSNES